MVKNLPANAGGASLIPGIGRSPVGGNGNPLQYTCLEIPWTEHPGGLESMSSELGGAETIIVKFGMLISKTKVE